MNLREICEKFLQSRGFCIGFFLSNVQKPPFSMGKSLACVFPDKVCEDCDADHGVLGSIQT